MRTQPQGGFLIAKIHQLAGRILARRLVERDIDINPAQGRILFVLWRHDGITVSELAKKTQLSKSTLTSMLDRLEKAGHLIRVPSKEDRRKIQVKRTRKDKAMEAKYVEISQEMTALFYRGFSEREIRHFENDLTRILGNLAAVEARQRVI